MGYDRAPTSRAMREQLAMRPFDRPSDHSPDRDPTPPAEHASQESAEEMRASATDRAPGVAPGGAATPPTPPTLQFLLHRDTPLRLFSH